MRDFEPVRPGPQDPPDTRVGGDNLTVEIQSIGGERRPAHQLRRSWRPVVGGSLAVVVALAGLIWVTGHGGTALPGPVPPPTSATVTGAATNAELESLSVEALATLGFASPADRDRYPGRNLPHRGVYFGALTGQIGVDFGRRVAFPPGMYFVKVVCLSRSGLGKVHLRVDSVQAAQQDLDIACPASAGEIAGLSGLELETPGVISVRITPDAQAKGEAGIAVEVENPLIVQAGNALGPGDFADRLIASGDQANPGSDSVVTQYGVGVSAPTVGEGVYRLRVACAGQGVIHIGLTTASAAATKDLTCRYPSAVVELSLKTTADGVLIELRITLDQTAVDAAGFAYILEGIGMGPSPASRGQAATTH